ncbi:methyltransferase [Pararhodobacter sp. SW119]|uniref:methyltransferase n=1 Tax=Pararhodobacter sp. SW119 TaxID=2780075 RepID=UPI001ADEDF60|nr:methyltransferase [Pararhodobacter sp. SW119]
MSDRAEHDWNPGTYERFRGFRLRPAMDLLAQVRDLPTGDIVDLGCGTGAAGPVLKERFPGVHRIGLDSSPAMLDRAAATGAYAEMIHTDIVDWKPATPPALIFSNAVLHWLDDHRQLLPGLAEMLTTGGVLAVQMPRNFDAPSHSLLRECAAQLFPDRFKVDPCTPPVRPARDYVTLLAPFGQVDGWETEYAHRLEPVAQGHPVRVFTESTAMRPVLARLSPAEAVTLMRDYDAALAKAYPAAADGSVLFPFRRVFFVLRTV